MRTAPASAYELILLEQAVLSMVVVWSFATILVLTLIALVTFSQPIFQTCPDALLLRAEFETPGATIERRAPLYSVPFKLELRYGPNTGIGRSIRGRRSRKLIRRDFYSLCSRDWSCHGSRRVPERISTPEGMPAREILANYHYPRRTGHEFESDRVVPSGPNPLHNSNRSQAIFP